MGRLEIIANLKNIWTPKEARRFLEEELKYPESTWDSMIEGSDAMAVVIQLARGRVPKDPELMLLLRWSGDGKRILRQVPNEIKHRPK